MPSRVDLWQDFPLRLNKANLGAAVLEKSVFTLLFDGSGNIEKSSLLIGSS
jgi:hypothetical protein